MAQIFFLNVMLWTYSSCFAEQAITSGFYQLLNEDESISNHFPFHVENTTSEIECLLKGQQQTLQTCFIQTEKIGKGVEWQCSFFDAIEKTGLEQQTKMNGKIYVLSKNKNECFNLFPRDCSQWYRNSYRKSGIYKIKNNNVIKEVYCDMNDTSPGCSLTWHPKLLGNWGVRCRGTSIWDRGFPASTARSGSGKRWRPQRPGSPESRVSV